MPELPEVQTIVTDLNKNIVGFRINRVGVTNGYKVYPDKDNFLKTLSGATVTDVKRVAKNIIVHLDNQSYLTIHLAMTGRILLKKPGLGPDPHQKLQIDLKKGQRHLVLTFCDMRMFGKAKVLNVDEIAVLSAKYGPDLYKESVETEDFMNRLQSKNTVVKTALLEQSVVTGLGNIYATDALWLAKIHPLTRTRDLNYEKFKVLLYHAREILKEGVEHRGSTLADRAYVDIFGNPGSHQEHFRVYGATQCPGCRGKVEYIKVGGRGTYFCPACQK